MRTINRLMRHVRKYWAWAIITAISMVITAALELTWPQFQKQIIDRCISHHRYDLLPLYSLGILGVFVLKGVFQFVRAYFSEDMAQRTVYDLRNLFFDHVQRLSFTYHDEAETGQLISRSTSDMDAITRFLGGGLVNLIVNSLVALGVFAICFRMNWKLALLSLSTMPFLAMVVLKYSKLAGPLYTDLQNHIGVMTAFIQQNTLGIRVVKAFANEDYEISKFGSLSDELFKRAIEATRVGAFYGPLMDFIAATGTTFILWYGGMQVLAGKMTIGELVAFNTYLLILIWPVRIMAWVISVIQNAVASANRVFEILDTRQETHLRDGTVPMTDCRGKVEFRDVSFRYADGSEALQHINIICEPGEMIALVGPTGSGKTSIINLLPRFYDCTSGSVLIDDVDVRNYQLLTLRRHVGMVAQETFLFADTVRQNIAYARPYASMEEIEEVARAANIHDFIMSLPDQYETLIGERGVNLSGGQKQRVSIARALLKNPPILILDDSTSSVDTETEALIQHALASLTQSRTTFVIAQRVSTVKRADKIIVLDRGRIVQSGTHAELLTMDGPYAEVYRIQFGERALAAQEEE